MAAPARTKIPPKAPARGSPAKPGKGRPVDPDDAPPPTPPATGLGRRAKLAMIAGGVAALALAAGGAGYVLYFGESEIVAPSIDEVAPPTPAPRPPQIGPVRQGDLNEELWRRMGVRPEGQ